MDFHQPLNAKMIKMKKWKGTELCFNKYLKIGN